MKLFQYVRNVGYVDTKCKTCEVLERWLEEEKAKREYYEQIILTKAGIIQKSEAEELREQISFPSVHRVNTLSSMRRQAMEMVANRAALKINTPDVLTELAEDKDKTPAEILFEKSLNGQKTVSAS